MKKIKKLTFKILISGIFLILITNCKKDNKDDITVVKDSDGNTYKTVVIGTQTWMVENLKSAKYRNGDPIETTTTASQVITNEITPKYQWAYNGNDSNVASYGRLYTWYAMMDSRNICPVGWHVPSDGEWNTLETFMGGSDVAGGKLKEIGFMHWNSPNIDAKDSLGFKALPGGYHDYDGTFDGLGKYGNWWSSSAGSTTTSALARSIVCHGAMVGHFSENKKCGFSVRCIKD